MLNPNYVIYLLVNTVNNCTYIGITNNSDRRLRQHNGELVGGAKYTHAKKGNGEWKFYGWVKGIGENILIKNRSLSLEKKIKIRSRKCKGLPLEKRITAINNILEENLDLEFQLQNILI
jgi:predicted GIY-YIG superfamily endonuclease